MDDNCYVEPIQKTVSVAEHQQVTTAFLAVWGMACAGCAMRIHNRLISLHGVVSAQVNHVNGIAMVDFNPHLITTDALIAAVARAGNDGRHKYQAKLIVERTL